MAKANVNTASRDELIEAGVRAEIADEIFKLRRKGKVALEALDELPGVGPATLEQLRKILDFSGLGQETVRESTKAVVEAGRPGLRLAQHTTAAAGEAQRELMHRTADSTAEFGRELTDLLQEQARYSFKLWGALGTGDWNQLWRLQTEYLRSSLDRAAQLTQRWQAVLMATAGTVHKQEQRAA
jgi:hypothetical protein